MIRYTHSAMSGDELHTVRPLSDKDVLREMKILNSMPADQMNQIIETYKNAIAAILNMVIAAISNEKHKVELDRVRRILNLCPDVEKFLRSKDKIWGARNHIRTKNAKYFLEKDYSALIKKDNNQTFIEAIIEIIKERYEEMPEKELSFYWGKAKDLLWCVARFKKAQQEYNKVHK